MAKLAYSPSSGHVKLNGAVVGIIEKKGNRVVFIEYKFKSVISCSAARLELLLPKIREKLLG